MEAPTLEDCVKEISQRYERVLKKLNEVFSKFGENKLCKYANNYFIKIKGKFYAKYSNNEISFEDFSNCSRKLIGLFSLDHIPTEFSFCDLSFPDGMEDYEEYINQDGMKIRIENTVSELLLSDEDRNYIDILSLKGEFRLVDETQKIINLLESLLESLKK